MITLTWFTLISLIGATVGASVDKGSKNVSTF